MKNILIFDDEEVIGMLYDIELSKEGYDVITSGVAFRCMELIREHRPNVVVMDNKMRKHDGVDVLREIRGQFPALPLILCTAYPSHGSEKGDMVADFYAVKSSDLKDLKLKIKAAVEI